MNKNLNYKYEIDIFLCRLYNAILWFYVFTERFQKRRDIKRLFRKRINQNIKK